MILLNCRTLQPVKIERIDVIPKEIILNAKTEKDLLIIYRNAYSELVEKFLFLIEEIKAADKKRIIVIDLKNDKKNRSTKN